MAEIHRLDGSKVKAAKIRQNENVANLIDELAKVNGRGRMSAMVAIYITPEGRWEAAWAWPPISEGLPWGMALQGALSMALADMAAVSIQAEPIAEPEDPAS